MLCTSLKQHNNNNNNNKIQNSRAATSYLQLKDITAHFSEAWIQNSARPPLPFNSKNTTALTSPKLGEAWLMVCVKSLCWMFESDQTDPTSAPSSGHTLSKPKLNKYKYINEVEV
jgi:hypothetical protein